MKLLLGALEYQCFIWRGVLYFSARTTMEWKEKLYEIKNQGRIYIPWFV